MCTLNHPPPLGPHTTKGKITSWNNTVNNSCQDDIEQKQEQPKHQPLSWKYLRVSNTHCKSINSSIFMYSMQLTLVLHHAESHGYPIQFEYSLNLSCVGLAGMAFQRHVTSENKVLSRRIRCQISSSAVKKWAGGRGIKPSKLNSFSYLFS